ncbi:MAG: hypothetical protein KC643_29905, partial [Nitrospira sp.]|nr:hypothetical protein [Nitrospira sp.]
MNRQTAAFLTEARSSLVIGPLATAFFRDAHNLQMSTLEGMADEHAQSFRLLGKRVQDVRRRIQETMQQQKG